MLEKMRLPLLLVALAAVIFAQPRGSGPVNFYSQARERELGGRFAMALVSALHAHADPRLEELGASLLGHVRDKNDFSFFAFDGALAEPLAGEIFAFPADWRSLRFDEAIALPGGPIFVSQALISRAPAHDDLAAILAHAIGHIVLRHPTQMATRVQMMDDAGMPNFMKNPLSSLGSFAKSCEIEADRYAIRLLETTGFDPRALVRYIETLPVPDSDTRSSILSVRPAPERRIEAIEQTMAEFR
jgi:Peptidase family M48